MTSTIASFLTYADGQGTGFWLILTPLVIGGIILVAICTDVVRAWIKRSYGRDWPTVSAVVDIVRKSLPGQSLLPGYVDLHLPRSRRADGRLQPQFWQEGRCRGLGELLQGRDRQGPRRPARPHAVRAARRRPLTGQDLRRATDGSDRLRYLVGEDAKAWASMLAGMDGEQYFANMSAIFGL